jgi:hypothetical protein
VSLLWRRASKHPPRRRTGAQSEADGIITKPFPWKRAKSSQIQLGFNSEQFFVAGRLRIVLSLGEAKNPVPEATEDLDWENLEVTTILGLLWKAISLPPNSD